MKDLDNINLSELSIEDLRSITQNAQNVIIRKQTQRLRDAYELFEQIAEEAGSSIEEILSMGEDIKQERSVRYRDPKNPENIWTGRGRKPNWLLEEVKNGNHIEDFAVEDAE